MEWIRRKKVQKTVIIRNGKQNRLFPHYEFDLTWTPCGCGVLIDNTPVWRQCWLAPASLALTIHWQRTSSGWARQSLSLTSRSWSCSRQWSRAARTQSAGSGTLPRRSGLLCYLCRPWKRTTSCFSRLLRGRCAETPKKNGEEQRHTHASHFPHGWAAHVLTYLSGTRPQNKNKNLL